MPLGAQRLGFRADQPGVLGTQRRHSICPPACGFPFKRRARVPLLRPMPSSKEPFCFFTSQVSKIHAAENLPGTFPELRLLPRGSPCRWTRDELHFLSRPEPLEAGAIFPSRQILSAQRRPRPCFLQPMSCAAARGEVLERSSQDFRSRQRNALRRLPRQSPPSDLAEKLRILSQSGQALVFGQFEIYERAARVDRLSPPRASRQSVMPEMPRPGTIVCSEVSRSPAR
jgi:hypothetical protein